VVFSIKQSGGFGKGVVTMPDLTSERLAELRRIASAATPGPWQWARSRDKGDPHAYVYAGDYASEGEPDLWCEIVSGFPEADAKHIATFDPATALALLDRIEALEQERDAARAEAERWKRRHDALQAAIIKTDALIVDAINHANAMYNYTQDAYYESYSDGLDEALTILRQLLDEAGGVSQ